MSDNFLLKGSAKFNEQYVLESTRNSVSQTVVRGPPVVRGVSPGGPQAASKEKHCTLDE
jgi:hypothetical protein